MIDEAELDMRFDQTSKNPCARDIINEATEYELN